MMTAADRVLSATARCVARDPFAAQSAAGVARVTTRNIACKKLDAAVAQKKNRTKNYLDG
jgi:hypothetical protein